MRQRGDVTGATRLVPAYARRARWLVVGIASMTALAGCMQAGPPEAEFESHGRRCRIRDGAIWLVEDDPTAPARLTGAEACQLEAVRRLVRAGVVALAEALTMASETPARALGLEHELGRIVVGARADLLVLDPRTLALREVLVGGEPVGLRGDRKSTRLNSSH